MKNYEVPVRLVWELTVSVEAENYIQAVQMAEEIDMVTNPLTVSANRYTVKHRHKTVYGDKVKEAKKQKV